MDKRLAIKELYKVQDETEQLRIINDYNLVFSGFTKINLNSLRINKKKFESEITNKINLSKFDNNLKVAKQNINIEMDYLLSAERIVDKYNINFDALIQIFEIDKYKETTTRIIEIITSMSLVFSNEQEDETETMQIAVNDSDTIGNLRDIISDLEDKLDKKESKIQALNNTMVKLRNENLELLKNIKTLKMTVDERRVLNSDFKSKIEELKETKNHIATLQQELSNKENDIRELRKNFNELEIKYKENLITYYIIGMSKYFAENKSGTNIIYFDNEQIDEYIDIHKNRTRNDMFIIYEMGLGLSDLRKIKKLESVNIISNIEEVEKMIEGNIDDK